MLKKLSQKINRARNQPKNNNNANIQSNNNVNNVQNFEPIDQSDLLVLSDVDNTWSISDDGSALIINDNLGKYFQACGVTTHCIISKMAAPKKVSAPLRSELIDRLCEYNIATLAVYTSTDIKVISVKKRALNHNNVNLDPVLSNYNLGDHYLNIVAPAELALMKLRKKAGDNHQSLSALYAQYNHLKAFTFWDTLSTDVKNAQLDEAGFIEKISEKRQSGEITDNIYNTLFSPLNNYKKENDMRRSGNEEPLDFRNDMNTAQKQCIELKNTLSKDGFFELFEIMHDAIVAEEKIDNACNAFEIAINDVQQETKKAILLDDILKAHPNVSRLAYFDDAQEELDAMEKELKKTNLHFVVSHPPMPSDNEADCMSFNGSNFKINDLCVDLDTFKVTLNPVMPLMHINKKQVVFIDSKTLFLSNNSAVYAGAVDYIQYLHSKNIGVVIVIESLGRQPTMECLGKAGISSAYIDPAQKNLPRQIDDRIAQNLALIFDSSWLNLGQDHVFSPLIRAKKQELNITNNIVLLIAVLSKITSIEPLLFVGEHILEVINVESDDEILEVDENLDAKNKEGQIVSSNIIEQNTQDPIREAQIPFIVAHQLIKNGQIAQSPPTDEESIQFFKGLTAYVKLINYIAREHYNQDVRSRTLRQTPSYLKTNAEKFLNLLQNGHNKKTFSENFSEPNENFDYLLTKAGKMLYQILKDLYDGIITRYPDQNPAIAPKAQTEIIMIKSKSNHSSAELQRAPESLSLLGGSLTPPRQPNNTHNFQLPSPQ